MLLVLASIQSAFATNFLELGDSNARSTRPDTLWAGRAVQDGYRFVDDGVESATWPAGNNPGVGKLPYLVENAIRKKSATGWVVRRGTNGATSAWTGPLGKQWAGAQADIQKLGGTPDKVILTFGANDSKEKASADAYLANMRRLIDTILATWPTAEIVIAKERTSDSGAATNYPYLRTTIYDAIHTLDEAYPQVSVADGSGCDLIDGIHWSVGGMGGGQECVAKKIEIR